MAYLGHGIGVCLFMVCLGQVDNLKLLSLTKLNLLSLTKLKETEFSLNNFSTSLIT